MVLGRRYEFIRGTHAPTVQYSSTNSSRRPGIIFDDLLLDFYGGSIIAYSRWFTFALRRGKPPSIIHVSIILDDLLLDFYVRAFYEQGAFVLIL